MADSPHQEIGGEMGTLHGKLAIVTGAGSGIGKAIVRVLAEEGATLVLSGRTRETLDETAREVAVLGAAVHVVSADVTDEAQVVALFEAAKRLAPTLDLLVNNAGAFDGGPIDDLSLATWNHVVAVNLTGPFLCTREAMRVMKRQRSGRIINIGSISAQVPRMHSAPYAATKHGLVGLTKAAALEGREYGVSVSCLHPGNVLTERRAASTAPQDAEPMMTPAELAEAVRTMATLPPHVNMLEAIILPVGQAYLGRG
jgi:NAD(P)-dependent dehydrogenase (short-subunit alcohol dehydrogenase family)